MANGRSPNKKAFKGARLASYNPISKTNSQLNTFKDITVYYFSPLGDKSCYQGSILNDMKKVILLPTLQCLIVGGVIAWGLVKLRTIRSF